MFPRKLVTLLKPDGEGLIEGEITEEDSGETIEESSGEIMGIKSDDIVG